MQDGLALLKVNVKWSTDRGGVNLVLSTHATRGFTEEQSVQSVILVKDFIFKWLISSR